MCKQSSKTSYVRPNVNAFNIRFLGCQEINYIKISNRQTKGCKSL